LTEVFDTLKRFAERGPSPWPVLSVYVNTRPIGPQMATYRPYFKKRMAEELKRVGPRSPEHESLTVDFARAQHFLDYELKDTTRAAAVFASYADDDLFLPVQVSREFAEPLVTVGPLPTIFPLIRMADRRARAAVLLSDSNTARLFVISLGAVEVRREVRSPALHKPKQAGELDPASLQHRVEEAWRKHARQAVQVLEELIREEPVSWIVIAGEEPIAAALAGNVSPAHRDKLLARQSWDIRIAEAELAAQVDALVEEKEKERRRARALDLVDRSGAGETVLGVAPVVDALRGSRVSSLVLSETMPPDAPAWACRVCHAFDAGPAPAACPACGAPQAHAVPLREELAARAQGVGAAVHFVEARAASAFDERGGIGAELRY
jgi:rubrerythrin